MKKSVDNSNSTANQNLTTPNPVVEVIGAFENQNAIRALRRPQHNFMHNPNEIHILGGRFAENREEMRQMRLARLDVHRPQNNRTILAEDQLRVHEVPGQGVLNSQESFLVLQSGPLNRNSNMGGVLGDYLEKKRPISAGSTEFEDEPAQSQIESLITSESNIAAVRGAPVRKLKAFKNAFDSEMPPSRGSNSCYGGGGRTVLKGDKVPDSQRSGGGGCSLKNSDPSDSDSDSDSESEGSRGGSDSEMDSSSTSKILSDFTSSEPGDARQKYSLERKLLLKGRRQEVEQTASEPLPAFGQFKPRRTLSRWLREQGQHYLESLFDLFDNAVIGWLHDFFSGIVDVLPFHYKFLVGLLSFLSVLVRVALPFRYLLQNNLRRVFLDFQSAILSIFSTRLTNAGFSSLEASSINGNKLLEEANKEGGLVRRRLSSEAAASNNDSLARAASESRPLSRRTLVLMFGFRLVGVLLFENGPNILGFLRGVFVPVSFQQAMARLADVRREINEGIEVPPVIQDLSSVLATIVTSSEGLLNHFVIHYEFYDELIDMINDFFLNYN